jgi:hypothetical protein
MHALPLSVPITPGDILLVRWSGRGTKKGRFAFLDFNSTVIPAFHPGQTIKGNVVLLNLGTQRKNEYEK